jgi:hypothetical protein
MNNGQMQHLENGFLTRLNRIHKLSKIAKAEFHDMLNDDFSEQDREISESRFNSMIEQIEEITKEIKANYSILKNERNS